MQALLYCYLCRKMHRWIVGDKKRISYKASKRISNTNKGEYMSTELIWMIDKDHINTEPDDMNRIHYGQRKIDAAYTQVAYDNMRRNITMSMDCSPIEIDRDQKIRWKAYDDDDEL